MSVDLDALFTEIDAKREAAHLVEAAVSPRSQPIASDIDPDSCLRRQVLEIVAWEKKRPFPRHLTERFAVGKLWEREIVAELLRLGLDVRSGQEVFEIKNRKGQPVLRGRIDGKIKWRGKLYPFEVKSMRPELFARVETLEDMDALGSSRKYPHQLQAYLIGHAHEEGFFVLTDCLGHWKLIGVQIDYEKAEALIAFAELVVRCADIVRADTGDLPDYTKDPEECRYCSFFQGACVPPFDKIAQARLVADDAAPAFARMVELKPAAKEHDAIEKQLKDLAKAAAPEGDATLLCGSFFARIKEVNVKAEAAPRKAHTQRRVTLGVLKPTDREE